MEVRGQEDGVKPSGSTSYRHKCSPEMDRSDGSHNGSNALTCTQSLDHVHCPQRQQSFGLGRSQNADPATIAPISKAVRYRECLKNHAASMGGNVFDGCGEFMPSGEEGSLEALKCAACDCHRNFHRKEVNGETQFSGNSSRRALLLSALQLPPPLPSPTMLNYSMHPSPSSAMFTPMNVAFGGTNGGTGSSSEDLNVFQSNEGMPAPPPHVLSKKRFRTKFTQEQREKMLQFAEKLGWRIDKQGEEDMEKFCAEVGVKRRVFKVWMHNNKNNVKKLQQDQ